MTSNNNKEELGGVNCPSQGQTAIHVVVLPCSTSSSSKDGKKKRRPGEIVTLVLF